MRRLFPTRLPAQPDHRWWQRTLLINAGIALLVAAAIQLFPALPDNPPVVREPVWDSPETRALAVQACYDCHSNETQWPWYARIAPISWVLAYDVIEGREALNFSEWDRHAVAVDPDEPFILHPGEFVLGSTLERVGVPDDLVGRVEPQQHARHATVTASCRPLAQFRHLDLLVSPPLRV